MRIFVEGIEMDAELLKETIKIKDCPACFETTWLCTPNISDLT